VHKLTILHLGFELSLQILVHIWINTITMQ
jgi:hypothetical protein